jgi:hypothetical protein
MAIPREQKAAITSVFPSKEDIVFGVISVLPENSGQYFKESVNIIDILKPLFYNLDH